MRYHGGPVIQSRVNNHPESQSLCRINTYINPFDALSGVTLDVGIPGLPGERYRQWGESFDKTGVKIGRFKRHDA